MKGVILLVIAGLALASVEHHNHPIRSKLRLYSSVPVDATAAPGAAGVFEIAAGLLYGIGLTTNSTQIDICLNDPVEIGVEVADAVAEIKEMTWDSVESGIHDLGAALEAVPAAMNACLGGVTEGEQLLENLLQKFEHPVSFFFQIELHLMVDGIDILKNINGAISDWDNGEWYSFGVDVGTALSLLISGSKRGLSAGHTLEVITGLLEGIVSELDPADFTKCIRDIDILGLDIQNSYEELLLATFDSIKTGLADLSDALQQLPEAISSCKAAHKKEVAKIQAALASFKSPFTFEYHLGKDLIINGIQIYKEVDKAVLAYYQKNYATFGYTMGEALAAILIGQPTDLSVTHTLEVVAGLLEGIAADLSLTDIENCITDAESIGEDIHSAYEEILQATFSSVKTGLHDLATALEIVPSAITSCKAGATTDVQKLEAMLNAFQNPISFVFHVGKDLVINGKAIFTEVAAAVRAYHAGNYTSFGFYMGEALSEVIVGDSPAVDVLEVIGGLLQGLADGIAISDISNCITDTETVAANLAEAVVELKKASNPTDAKAAIHDFGMALEFLPGAITNCDSAAKNDGAALAQMIKNFENPLTFMFVVGKNLVINGDEIYDEMSAAISDWDAQNWTGFGVNLGEALAKTFL